ncbi:type VI secretion system-associated FHA domain protein [Vibrio sp. SCSIO 43137]|uniref:type VI secretion system-associated FHA domain protein n=1 Tax=Vibrio sp. SCSIO 43137 TaxID=3021011 RepID=UPI0023079696|nr:FHA domain-containing protein [Vibrio sp. SCSIO 43137]WCE31029.1 FHA domain-containing protein [Vibrio sp. SCSIO 43137]
MPLSIRIISSPDGENITEWNKQFPEEGGDIGRAFGSTLQLNDATRELSNTHAIIKKSGRGYHIIDNSSNGLYLNGNGTPLGKGNQSPLNDGDVLDMGRFRLLVSCFVPSEPALLSRPLAESADDVFDDPFASVQEETESSGKPAKENEIEEVKFTISDYAVVEDDPFGGEVKQKSSKAEPVKQNFSDMDDDPFAEVDLSPDFATEAHAVQPEESLSFASHSPVSPENSLAEDPYYKVKRYEPDIEQAIEMALTRLLTELSPEHLESMFDDLSTPGLFRRQPKYWDLYKRYFKRQINSRDLHVKFNAYFKDSIKVQHKLEGEKE